MTYQEAQKLLQEQGQSHLLHFWGQLDATRRGALLQQIAALDFKEVARMRQLLMQGVALEAQREYQPARVIDLSGAGRAAAVAQGEEALRQGEVAALLVAGGQGSRLGYDGPKGAYAIGPVSDLPLFYFHCRKLLRLKRLYGRVPLYIMTSAINDAATRACFERYDYFGLAASDVHFFQQGTWPALDEEGCLILEEAGRIFVSPDGHGGTLSALVRSGALADMRKRGIQDVFYFQVDNPLVDIADPAFVGLHLREQAEMSLKLCRKSAPQEKVGVVAELSNGRLGLIEYSELTAEQAARFEYGSPAIHLFTLAFLERMARLELPLHIAHKAIPYANERGERTIPDSPNGYKFEKFIFDVLPQAQRAVSLAFERADEFAPVKNAQGEDSPESCRQALQAKWRRWCAAAGISVPADIPLEIDPAFCGGAAELRNGILIKTKGDRDGQ